MAKTLVPGALAVLDYTIRNSATLEAAFESIARYSRLLHSGVTVSLTYDDVEAQFNARHGLCCTRLL